MKIEYAVAPIEVSQGSSRTERQNEAVRLLVKRIAGEEAMVGHASDGAPFIVGRELSISISHSRNFATIAWCEDCGIQIGIDIEEAREEQLRRVVAKFLTREESDYYGTIPSGLLRAWTLKEAAYKALRNGLPDLRLYHLPLNESDRTIKVDGRGELGIYFSSELEVSPGGWLSIVYRKSS